jgi:hypothetical protein
MRRFVVIAALAATLCGATQATPATKAQLAAARAQAAAKAHAAAAAKAQAAAAQPAPADPAEEPGFLFDALRGYHYHMSWDKLFSAVKNPGPVPDWLMNFDREREGAAGEMKPVTVEGKPYTISYVCKPEDCLGHRFVVLFEAGGVHAYGALGGKDEPPEFYGAPNPAQQEALTAAMHPAAQPEAKSK